MKKLLVCLFAILSAIAMISCGGDGTAKTFSATAQTVQNIQRFWLLSMANSGLGLINFGGSGSGTTGGTGGTGGSGGSGGGVTSIGGFIRHFGGPNGIGPAMTRHALEGGSSGSTGGGTGGGTGGDVFYYDEWLNLWVETQWTDTTFASNFFIDQAKTQAAGHVTSTFTGNWNTFPQVYTSDYAFTAGTLAGAHGNYNCTQASEFEGSMVYTNVYADTSHDQGSANWTVAGSAWQSRWDGPNGAGWFEDSGTWNAAGNGTYTCSSSDGWSSAWLYSGDGSGSAHFEGPDPNLPADMTWTSTGHFKITYADGTSEEWTWDDIWSGDSGSGGTTGTGGGVVAPPAPVKQPAPEKQTGPEKKAA